MRRWPWLIALIALALPLEPEVHPAVASGPATLTVRILGGATKTALYLQPGFATVLRADHRIDTVAIGDPRIVMATTVKRGQDVYDLVLQPQTTTGVTNMVVWLGEVTSIWDLMVGSARRTADIVYVVTAPQPAAAHTPKRQQAAALQRITPAGRSGDTTFLRPMDFATSPPMVAWCRMAQTQSSNPGKRQATLIASLREKGPPTYQCSSRPSSSW